MYVSSVYARCFNGECSGEKTDLKTVIIGAIPFGDARDTQITQFTQNQQIIKLYVSSHS